MSAPDLVQRCWNGIASRRSCPAEAADAMLDEILRSYGEPHRHYHTLDHVAALLSLLGRYGDGVRDREALTLAILLHDIVYDPARLDNEQASATLAATRLVELGFPQELTAKIARYILATRHDQPVEALREPDLALLLDLDLSILAAAPDAYCTYAEAVRREYALVPDPLYRRGRRRVLETFLARERIYLTDQLRGLWEPSARANLAAEIAGLAQTD